MSVRLMSVHLMDGSLTKSVCLMTKMPNAGVSQTCPAGKGGKHALVRLAINCYANRRSDIRQTVIVGEPSVKRH